MVMSVALAAIAYFIYLDITWTPQLVVLFVIIFNGFFGYSWGIAFLTELIQAQSRGYILPR
jgi:hypothetical protein